jgi:hypothetical protein
LLAFLLNPRDPAAFQPRCPHDRHARHVLAATGCISRWEATSSLSGPWFLPKFLGSSRCRAGARIRRGLARSGCRKHDSSIRTLPPDAARAIHCCKHAKHSIQWKPLSRMTRSRNPEPLRGALDSKTALDKRKMAEWMSKQSLCADWHVVASLTEQQTSVMTQPARTLEPTRRKSMETLTWRSRHRSSAVRERQRRSQVAVEDHRRPSAAATMPGR